MTEILGSPESGVVEGVQAGRVRPPDGAALAAQLHAPPGSQRGGLAQTHKTALFEDLGEQGLAPPPSSLPHLGRLDPGPLPSRPAAVLSRLLPPLGLLAEAWTDGETQQAAGGGGVEGMGGGE